MKERTLIIIKPDVVRANKLAEAWNDITALGFKRICSRLASYPEVVWREFYAEHAGKSFFGPLVTFMASGMSQAAVVEAEQAIGTWRVAMGSSDPQKCLPTELRAKYGTDMPANAFHGSDSPAAARREIEFFFSRADILQM